MHGYGGGTVGQKEHWSKGVSRGLLRKGGVYGILFAFLDDAR